MAKDKAFDEGNQQNELARVVGLFKKEALDIDNDIIGAPRSVIAVNLDVPALHNINEIWSPKCEKLKTKMLEVLKKLDFTGLDYDDLMDRRDESEFDSEWGKAYELIEGRQELVLMKGEIDLISEWSFKYVFSQTRHHEMAATVSDDFDLIISAAILGIDDSWINALWWEYKSGRIPTGVLPRRPGAVKDSI